MTAKSLFKTFCNFFLFNFKIARINETIKNETLVLDCHEFDGCVLEDCTLIFKGKSAALSNCKIIRPLILLKGQGMATFQFLQAFFESEGKESLMKKLEFFLEGAKELNKGESNSISFEDGTWTSK